MNLIYINKTRNSFCAISGFCGDPYGNLPASGKAFTECFTYPPFRFPRYIFLEHKKEIASVLFLVFVVTPTGIEPMIPP